MQNYKNKKRLTVAALLLMLTLVGGGAFAATPGVLQVAGGFGFGDEQLHIIWTDTEVEGLMNVATTNEARIVDHMTVGGASANHRVNHRVEWAVGFVSEGAVTLTATAENVGQLPALLATPGTAIWSYLFADDIIPFTLGNVVALNHRSETNTLIEANPTFPVNMQVGDTVDVQITLAWDGVAPFSTPGSPIAMPASDFNNWAIDGWLVDLLEIEGDYEWVANFLLELVYSLGTPAP